MSLYKVYIVMRTLIGKDFFKTAPMAIKHSIFLYTFSIIYIFIILIVDGSILHQMLCTFSAADYIIDRQAAGVFCDASRPGVGSHCF